MTTELIGRLRLGASISRDRKLNLDYAMAADKAADAIEALQARVAELDAELAAIRAQKPVTYRYGFERQGTGDYWWRNTPEQWNGLNPVVAQPLYAAPVAPKMRKATRDEKIVNPGVYEVPCTAHPDAPHGFNRNSSHTLGRYVCDCEGWVPDNVKLPGGEAIRAE